LFAPRCVWWMFGSVLSGVFVSHCRQASSEFGFEPGGPIPPDAQGRDFLFPPAVYVPGVATIFQPLSIVVLHIS
jgi:hypothetical protein